MKQNWLIPCAPLSTGKSGSRYLGVVMLGGNERLTVANLDSKVMERIGAYKQIMEKLELAWEAELQKQFDKRRFKYILFLSLEKKRYSFALSEMEALLQEPPH